MEWYLWVLSIYGAMALFCFVMFSIASIRRGKYSDFKDYRFWILVFFQPFGFAIVIYAITVFWIIAPINLAIYKRKVSKSEEL